MKPYLVLIPIFFLSLLQGAILPLNLVLLVVLVWSAIRPAKQGLIVAFFSGIFLDLTKGTSFGFSSLVLLIACYLLRLYSRRFDPVHPVFLFIFVFLFSTGWNLIVKEPWLVEGLVLAAFSLLARPIIKFYQEDLTQDRLKLEI